MLPTIPEGLDWLKANLQPTTTFILVVTALAGLATILYPIIPGLIRLASRTISFFRNLWRMVNHQPIIPSITMRIRPRDHSLRWSFPLGAESHSTLFHGEWQFTNITDRTIFLVSVKITSPRKARTVGYLPQGEYVPIPPDQNPVNVLINFRIRPAIHKQGKPYEADIAFIDQYHNEHIVKNNIFRPPNPPPE
jgi:hypothetical protein